MALKFASEVMACVSETTIATLHVVSSTAKVLEATTPKIVASTAFALNEAAIIAADTLYDEEAHSRLDSRIAEFGGLNKPATTTPATPTPATSNSNVSTPSSNS